MLKIDIHTHILPPEIPKFKDRFGYGGFVQLHPCGLCEANMAHDSGKVFRKVKANCYEAKPRLEDCSESGVDIQVLSTVPVMFSYFARPKDGAYVATFLNDHMAQVVSDYPKKFIGLGTVPMQDTDLAILELEKCKERGLCGVQIGSNINGQNLSEKRFFPFWKACEELDMAVFVHPWEMLGQKDIPHYWLAWLVGMPAETSRAICSMIFGGVFERFKKLRVAFAHGGGAFPATVGRIAHGFKVRPDLCAVHNDKGPRDYLGKFYVDSLVHDIEMLRYLVGLVGCDKVALGTDYPFPLGEHRPGELIETGGFSQEERSWMLGQTALAWLNMKESELRR